MTIRYPTKRTSVKAIDDESILKHQCQVKTCFKPAKFKKSTNCFARIFGCSLMPIFVCFISPMLLKSLCLQYTHRDKGETIFSTGL